MPMRTSISPIVGILVFVKLANKTEDGSCYTNIRKRGIPISFWVLTLSFAATIITALTRLINDSAA